MKYVQESHERSLKERKEYTLFGTVNVFIKDAFSTDIDMTSVISDIEDTIPTKFIYNIDMEMPDNQLNINILNFKNDKVTFNQIKDNWLNSRITTRRILLWLLTARYIEKNAGTESFGIKDTYCLTEDGRKKVDFIKDALKSVKKII